MILGVYSVFDKAVSAYMQPFYCRSKGEAIRSFTEAVNDPSKPFGKYAVDYQLVELGEFDDNSGLFVGHGPLRVLGATEVIHDEVFTPATRVNGGAESHVSS